jgi:hypothetical protein
MIGCGNEKRIGGRTDSASTGFGVDAAGVVTVVAAFFGFFSLAAVVVGFAVDITADRIGVSGSSFAESGCFAGSGSLADSGLVTSDFATGLFLTTDSDFVTLGIVTGTKSPPPTGCGAGGEIVIGCEAGAVVDEGTPKPRNAGSRSVPCDAYGTNGVATRPPIVNGSAGVAAVGIPIVARPGSSPMAISQAAVSTPTNNIK